MPDWFVLLTPLLVALVALPLLFIGCTPFGAEEAPPQPGDPAVPPPPVAADTVFQLNLGSNLLKLFPGASPTNYPNGVTVDFLVFDKASEAATTIVLVPPPIKPSTPGSPPTLKPDVDLPTEYRATATEIGARNGVRCKCVVSLTGTNFVDAPTPPLTAPLIDLTKGYRHVFRLEAAQIPGQPAVRAFKVVFESATGM